MKKSDSRCCGSGACIINDAGECWCGQKWDGEKMAHLPFNLNQPQGGDMKFSLYDKQVKSD